MVTLEREYTHPRPAAPQAFHTVLPRPKTLVQQLKGLLAPFVWLKRQLRRILLEIFREISVIAYKSYGSVCEMLCQEKQEVEMRWVRSTWHGDWEDGGVKSWRTLNKCGREKGMR